MKSDEQAKFVSVLSGFPTAGKVGSSRSFLEELRTVRSPFPKAEGWEFRETAW